MTVDSLSLRCSLLGSLAFSNKATFKYLNAFRNNSYPAKVGLAQPSGLALDPGFAPSGALFIADSESSTVRRSVSDFR